MWAPAHGQGRHPTHQPHAQPRQPHLRRRGSRRCRARRRRTAAPSRGAGSGTARCGGRRRRAGSLPPSSGRLREEGCGHTAAGTRLPAPPIPRGTLTGTGGEAVETGGALLAGGAGVAGTAAAQPARAAELVQGPVGVAVAGCGGHRVRPRLHGGAPAPPLRPRPAAHRGSWGSRGGPGGSGHSGGLRTRAGRGSGQPRRSPWAGSPHGCSHTLWGREAPRGAERGGRAPAHTPAPRPLGTPRSRWQRGKWK